MILGNGELLWIVLNLIVRLDLEEFLLTLFLILRGSRGLPGTLISFEMTYFLSKTSVWIFFGAESSLNSVIFS